MTLIVINSKKWGKLEVKISDEDYELVIPFRWYVCRLGNIFYAVSSHYGRSIKMHRLIRGVTDENVLIDHINGDGLDNTRENLRIATKSENGRNARKRSSCSSNYKGVYFCKIKKKWAAQIHDSKKKIFLGYHSLEVDAAMAYDKQAKLLFSTFARLNIK